MDPTRDPRPLTCPRCGNLVRARGHRPARYCAFCGLRLTPLQVDVRDALSASGETPAAARWSRTLGICSLLLGVLPPLGGLAGTVAIGLGLSALHRIDRSGGQLRGRGLAIAGIVLGSLALLLSCLLLRLAVDVWS